MAETSVSTSRRRLLLVTASVASGLAGVAVAAPFFLSMLPSARARAAGAPVEVDISRVEPGMMIRAEWRSQPIWIVHRTPQMLETLPLLNPRLADPDSSKPMQPDYAKNLHRSRKPEWLILLGICTHLGCSPTDRLKAGPESGLGEDWLGGFFCPCHGSKFDVAGRVFKDVPAPTNLVVPRHAFLTDTRLLIGAESPGA